MFLTGWKIAVLKLNERGKKEEKETRKREQLYSIINSNLFPFSQGQGVRLS